MCYSLPEHAGAHLGAPTAATAVLPLALPVRGTRTSLTALISSSHQEVDVAFAQKIEANTLRYVKLFGEAADALLPPPTVDIRAKRVTLDIVADFRARHSESAAAARAADGNAGMDVADDAAAELANRTEMPAELRRRLCVSFGVCG